MRVLFTVTGEELGSGAARFGWSPRGHYLAVAGSKPLVRLYARDGTLHEELRVPAAQGAESGGCCLLKLQWNPNGDKLAFLPRRSPHAYIWISTTREVRKLDTGLKNPDLTWMSWSKDKDVLMIATSKGHVLFYNDHEGKKIPIMGKHTKRIACGAWSDKNIVALGGEDKQVSLSCGATGDTLKTVPLPGNPVDLEFGSRKLNGNQQESILSVCMNRKSICFMEVHQTRGEVSVDSPVDLVFQEKYGTIEKHQWFGDGYVIVGFSSGQVTVVSSHRREVNEEVYSEKYLANQFSDLAYCKCLGRVAIGGGCSVRVLSVATEFGEVRSDALEFDAEEKVARLAWTEDGQVLTVSTTAGKVYNYLASLPMVFSTHATKLLRLTSLLEMSIVDVNAPGKIVKIKTPVEPACCGIGLTHAAVGMNNQVWFYRYDKAEAGAVIKEPRRVDYLGAVDSIRINKTRAAVLTEGRVIVHDLELQSQEGTPIESVSTYLPPQTAAADVSCFGISDHFLTLGTRRGALSYYACSGSDHPPVNEFRTEGGRPISLLLLQPRGTRLIFDDGGDTLFLFNPVSDQCVPVPDFGGVPTAGHWDCTDGNVFVLTDGRKMCVYAYASNTVRGDVVRKLGEQGCPEGCAPALVSDGVAWCHGKNGVLERLTLHTHSHLQGGEAGNTSRVRVQRRFEQCLELFRLGDAWGHAQLVGKPEALARMGEAALECLEIELAIAAYRKLGDASMVLSLESIMHHEDRNLLAGHVLVLLGGDVNRAQELFLRSTHPAAALEMRKDLKQWDEALKLAEQLDPDQAAEICAAHAQKLEMQGDYAAARQQYCQAAIKAGQKQRAKLAVDCQCGIARVTLQLGAVREGKKLALELGNQKLLRDCAGILQSMNHLQDAAELYESAGLYEKATVLYIQSKSFHRAAPLMSSISDPRLHMQYGKAKEKEGRYEEAVEAYRSAGDWQQVVRLLLSRLDRVKEAMDIVRKRRAEGPALLVAGHCLDNGNFREAVEFFAIANEMRQAFELAESHGEMDAYAAALTSASHANEYRRIAAFYESRREFEKAGDMYCKCDLHSNAVDAYMKVGRAAVHKCIEVIRASHDRRLAGVVLDHVMGLDDGAERDQQYIFQLHLSLGQYEEAAKCSLEMAKLEQEHGNYREAHSQLFATCQKLTDLGQQTPLELRRALMLLHSYTIAKLLTQCGDHMGAARMLVRVAENVSRFPAHIVPILTSTVIECQRSGLKTKAFEYASVLMRPEYRNKVHADYRRKIEGLVRKPQHTEDPEEELSECPYCHSLGKQTDLQCHYCQSLIPFCIASGKRMKSESWAECPLCHFPCQPQEMVRLLAVRGVCPMCQQPLNPSHFQRPLVDEV